MATRPLVWIDDSYVGIKNVVRGTWPILWREGIINRAVFLGNNDDRAKETDPDLFRRFVQSFFNDFEKACDRNSVKVLNSVSNDISNDNFTRGLSFIDKSDQNTPVWTTITAWRELSDKTSWEGKCEDNTPQALPAFLSVTPIISSMNLSEDAVCVLDVILLEGDVEKLACEYTKSVPIISMEIYHEISQKHTCLLYSRYSSGQQLRDNWKQLYKSRYGVDTVEIFKREGLYKGALNEVIHKEIITKCRDGE